MPEPVPTPDAQSGLRALKAMLRERHPLAALQVFNDDLGDVFRVNLPGFTPVIMVGPEAARFVLVQARGELRWRNEADPVVDLLQHGVLVEDDEEHDRLRHLLNPALHRRMLADYVKIMWECVVQVTDTWEDGFIVDMLVEMRKIALLILMRTLYCVDFAPHLGSLWNSVLGCIKYISPGLWMIWKRAPRYGYQKAIHRMDTYLYQIITERRRLMTGQSEPPVDMLGFLIHSGLEDSLIRDQLLTMLIAGHDTVTALMAWTLYLLGLHPEILKIARREAGACLDPFQPPSIEQVNQMEYLDNVERESLRLYPPIHLGSRLAATDLEFKGLHIPVGERVIYSIYLTQRHKDYWPDPHRFDPDRHKAGRRQMPYTWLAFGGGPRNCIGAAFGQLEAKVVLGYVLRRFELRLEDSHVSPYMGATLEPHPGVKMRVLRRVDV